MCPCVCLSIHLLVLSPRLLSCKTTALQVSYQWATSQSWADIKTSLEILFYVYECFACIPVHHMCAWCPGRQKRELGFLVLELQSLSHLVTAGNLADLGPLEERPSILTTEPSLQHWLYFLNIYLFYVNVLLHVWMCTTCMPGACRGHRRVVGPLGLELWTWSSHHVDAGNWIWVIRYSLEDSGCKSSITQAMLSGSCQQSQEVQTVGRGIRGYSVV